MDIIGRTDLPRIVGETDLLNMDAYSSGLCKFIAQCKTPMSIALQGDWGSGKTSVMNQIEDELNKCGIKTVLVNTWQYSQVSTSDKLSKVFFASIVSKVGGSNDVLAKKILDSMELIGHAALDSFKIKGKDLLGVVTSNANNIELIETLKENFQKYVAKSLEKHEKADPKHNSKEKLVILVDDLDRLNPDVAVELLEIIKLFMDVEKCVYVLAIDYDVVVRGVKSKFGQDVSLEKCKSFFEKIIQLPFHMPVETYKLSGMIEAFLSDKIDIQFIDMISDFSHSTLRGNPRALKRLVNSFLLVEIIQNNLNKDDEKSVEAYNANDKALLFCILCIQIHYTELYSYLSEISQMIENDVDIFVLDTSSTESTREDMRGKIEPYLKEDIDDKKIDRMASVLSQFEKVLDEIYADDSSSKLVQLEKVLTLSAVTGVVEAKTSENSVFTRSSAAEIDYNNGTKQYGSGVEALLDTAASLFKNHPNTVVSCVNQFGIFLTVDPNRKGGVFHTQGTRCKPLEGVYYSKNGGSLQVFIGVHTSTVVKQSQLKQLCTAMKLPKGSIVWRDMKDGKETLIP